MAAHTSWIATLRPLLLLLLLLLLLVQLSRGFAHSDNRRRRFGDNRRRFVDNRRRFVDNRRRFVDNRRRRTQVAAPSFSTNGGTHAANVRSISTTITTSTGSSAIRYTVNQGNPSNSYGLCGSSSCTHTFYAHLQYFGEYTIRAIAYRSDWINSHVSTSAKFYLKRIVAPPSFTPNGGEAVGDVRSLKVSFGSPTNQATDWNNGEYLTSCTTRYIVNGGTPTASSGTVGNTYTITAGASEATYTIKAISYKSGWADSDVSTSNTFTTRAVVAAPTFSPDGAAPDADTRSVSFSTASSTSGAEIRHIVQKHHGSSYTIQNSNPQIGAAHFNANNYIEVALGNTTRIKVASDHSLCLAAVENAGVSNGQSTGNAAVQNGAQVSVVNCDSSSDNQKWLFDMNTDMIRYKTDGRFCLRSGASNGHSVTLQQCDGCSSCGWLFDGTRITYKASTGYCMRRSGSSVDVYSCSTGATMQWSATNVLSTRAFSMATWARIETTSADNSQLWGLERDSVRLQVHSDSRLRTEAGSGSSSYSSNSLVVRDGQWHHIVVTYGTSYSTIFIDGVQQAGQGSAINAAGFNKLRLGHGFSSNTARLLGQLQDFRLFRTELTSSQVLALYEDATSGIPSSYWRYALHGTLENTGTGDCDACSPEHCRMGTCADFTVHKMNKKCSGTETVLGSGYSVERCAEACRETTGCHFFAVGSGASHGNCHWQDNTCTSFTSNTTYHVYKLTPAYRLRKSAHECNGGDTLLATGLSLEDCAHLCAETSSCTYFLMGYGSNQGKCYREDNTCTSYTSNTYNTYELIPMSGITHSRPDPQLEGTSSAAVAYWGGGESWSTSHVNPVRPGWLTIADQGAGSGNHASFDEDRFHTLDFVGLPKYVESGDYDVRIEWGSNNYMQFHVPSGSNIFSQSSTADVTISSVSTSVSSPSFGSSAKFCHKCVVGGSSKPGDTCWAVTPSGDSNRACGCSSGGWAGTGIYMGGYKNANLCGGNGGGFVGAKGSGSAKGNINSIGFVMKIRGKPSGTTSTSVTLTGSTMEASTYVVRAVATKAGMVNSEVVVSSPFSTRRIAATPTFSLNGGTHLTNARQVSTDVDSTLSEVRNRYTVNGANPTTTSGTVGKKTIFTAAAAQGTYTVRAVSYKAGWSTSDVVTSNNFVTKPIVAAPTFSPDGGNHSANTRSMSFSASPATTGSTLKYVIHTNQGSTRGATSVDFDGNNYIELSSLTSMSTQSFSMSAWFKTSTSCPDGRDWMGAGTNQIRATVHSNGKPKLGSDHATNGVSSGDGSTAIRDGNWHHLMVTYGTNFVKMYVDGVEEQSAPPIASGSFTAVRFGGSFTSGNNQIIALAQGAMVWTRELSPQMAHSVHSGADDLARLTSSGYVAAQYASQASSMPWRGYSNFACHDNYETSTVSLDVCKQNCMNRRGCQRGMSHASATNECRLPQMNSTNVHDCVFSTLPRHTFWVYAGNHPRPDYHLKLDGEWHRDSDGNGGTKTPSLPVTETTSAGTFLCVDCSSTPSVAWHSYSTQTPRYETGNNMLTDTCTTTTSSSAQSRRRASSTANTCSSVTNGLKVTGWDHLLLNLPASMSTTHSTVAVWAKTERDSPDWAEWWGADAYKLRLEMRPSGCPQLDSDDGTKGQASSDSIVNLRDGYWHHLAVVYGSSSVELFVDGVSTLTATALTSSTFTNFKLGGSYDTNGVGIRATFQDLRLWKTTLGQQQVVHAMDMDESVSEIHQNPPWTSNSVNRLVQWTGASGVTASTGLVVPLNDYANSNLALGWTRGAYSSEKIAHFSYTGSWSGVRAVQEGVQGVQFRCAGRPAQHQCIGLNNDNPNQDCNSIDFAFVCRNRVIAILESGTDRGTFGGYSTTDLLQVRVNQNGNVEYVQNDNVLYVSGVNPTYPLGVDTSFNNPSGRLEDVTWIGPGSPRPSWHYTLDSTLDCLNCNTGPSAPSTSNPTATYAGGHAKWNVESKPAGSEGAQNFYQWRDTQASAAGTQGTTATAGTSILSHWGSVWVSAIAYKTGMADSDVVRSKRYYISRIAAAPSFSPDGGTHDAHLRTIPVTMHSSTELASIRFVVDGAPSCGATFTSCSGTLFNSYFKNGLGFSSASTTSFILGPADTTASMTHVVKAIAYRDGWSSSDVTTSASYTVKQIVASPSFTPNGGVFASSPVSVSISSATSGASIRYVISNGNQEAAVYPNTVGQQYSSALSLTHQMGTTSSALATSMGIINVSAIATKAGYADSDVMANVFVVGEVDKWVSGGSVPVSQIALDFVKSGLRCEDVLDCKGVSSSDSIARLAQLELATGECVCKSTSSGA